MTTGTRQEINGVDVDQLQGTVNTIKDDPSLAKLRFRSTTEWPEGAHSRTLRELCMSCAQSLGQ